MVAVSFRQLYLYLRVFVVDPRSLHTSPDEVAWGRYSPEEALLTGTRQPEDVDDCIEVLA